MVRLVVAALVAVVVPVAGTAVFAHEPCGRGHHFGWGPGTAYGRIYDVRTVETVRGEVSALETFTGKGMSAGRHLRIKTGTETVSVHLGPEWYLEQQDVQIEAGDIVEVKGSRVSFQGAPAIIAAEVRRGEATLTLRDASGWPVWSGWRRR
jgi:hypothetical protein